MTQPSNGFKKSINISFDARYSFHLSKQLCINMNCSIYLNTLFFYQEPVKFCPASMFLFWGPISTSNVLILFLFAAVAINASSYKNCYGWHARFKIQLFWAGNSSLWMARAFKVRLLAGHSVLYTDIQYMRACNQLVVEVSVYGIQHICRKYAISRVGRL